MITTIAAAMAAQVATNSSRGASREAPWVAVAKDQEERIVELERVVGDWQEIIELAIQKYQIQQAQSQQPAAQIPVSPWATAQIQAGAYNQAGANQAGAYNL